MGTRNHAATREVLMVFAVALGGLAIVAVAMLGPYAWADRTGGTPSPSTSTVVQPVKLAPTHGSHAVK
jgi:hypothetical protein